MVVTLVPATALTAVMQDRVARPSTSTVQAPHMPIPPPNLVPVRPISSRIVQRRGVSSGLRTETVRSLSSNVIMIEKLQTPFSLGGRRPLSDGSNPLFHVCPGAFVRACATQISGKPRDVVVREGRGEAGHQQTGAT